MVERPDGTRRIKVDDQYQFGSSLHRALYERQGNLPLLLHPDPQRVAFVGSATGGVAASAVLHPVERIDLIELVPEVHALAAQYFAQTNRGVHGDPRARLIHEDGRNHLRASKERYDVVVEDLFVPSRPSSASMYSVNHYREVREHLSPNGVFCQWQAIYQHDESTLLVVVASFLEVFPNATLWRPNASAKSPILGLVGIRGAPLSAQSIAARTAELAKFGIEDRWVTNPDGLWTLYVGRAEDLFDGRSRPHLQSDDTPTLEYLAARGSTAARRDFVTIGYPRLMDRLARSLGRPDPIFPGRPTEAPIAGRELVRSSLALLRGDRAAARRDRERASRRLPEHLLGTPDPSFVWTPPERQERR